MPFRPAAQTPTDSVASDGGISLDMAWQEMGLSTAALPPSERLPGLEHDLHVHVLPGAVSTAAQQQLGHLEFRCFCPSVEKHLMCMHVGGYLKEGHIRPSTTSAIT